MNKRILSIIILLFVLSFSLLLLGCQHEQIKFYRESAASSLINKIGNTSKPQVKSSSGIIILRDENESSKVNINFGPRDIIFDMPARLK